MSFNFDNAELHKFAYASSDWWDPEGPFRPLHDMNPLRCNYIDARSPVVERQVLDIGCGGGILCEALQARGGQVTGIDLTEEALEAAREHASAGQRDIRYQQISAEELAAQQPARFDIVSCLEMLEHVPNPAAVVQAAADLVKPGGHVYFSTINRTPFSYLLAIVGGEYVLRLLPRGTHRYEMLIRPRELAGWVRRSGLRLMEIKGVRYQPLTRRFSLSSTPRVNYLVHARRPG